MTHTHSTAKGRTFTHLTEMKRGLALREIARRMGRHVSAISHEKNVGLFNKWIPTAIPTQKTFLTLVRVFTKRIVNTGRILRFIADR